MLVLMRDVGEELVLTSEEMDPVFFRLIEVRQNKARIGITAAPGVRVLRRELYERELLERAERGMGAITEDYDKKPACRAVNDKREDD